MFETIVQVLLGVVVFVGCCCLVWQGYRWGKSAAKYERNDWPWATLSWNGKDYTVAFEPPKGIKIPSEAWFRLVPWNTEAVGPEYKGEGK